MFKIHKEEIKIKKPKKTSPRKAEEPVLQLNEEEPLILDQPHEEKIIQKESFIN